MKMLNKSGSIFIISLLLISCSFEKVQAQLLWKVTPSGVAPGFYLFGTMHLSAGKFLDENPYIQEAIKNSDAIYTEASLENPDIGALISKYIFLPQGVLLSDSLNITEWNALDSTLMGFGNPMISASSLNNCKPIYVLLLTSGPLMQLKDTSMAKMLENSVDYSVVQYAIQNKKYLHYLETAEQQLQYLFNDPPLDMQFRLLRTSLGQSTAAADSMAKLVKKLPQFYRKQDLDTIALIMEYVNIGSPDVQILYSSLLGERNKRWMEAITHFNASQGRAFVAVGAGHLVGENGLIALLRAAGYNVEPVMPKK